MGRSPRIEGENLWYHVFNRGNEKRDIFFIDDDRTFFLDLLFESAAMFNVEVHTFSLMPNHFHLFIRTLEPNLCRFMHSYMNKFVKGHNKANQRVGRLFQGPYRAIVVDSNEYGHELSRYIHLNWVRGHGWENAPMRHRLRALNDYSWSSYRIYAGLETPRWPVQTSEILADFGSTPKKQRKRYTRYVKEGLLKEIDPFANVVAHTILGGDGFVRSIKKLLINSERHDATAARITAHILSPELGEVIAAVEKVFSVPRDLLLTPRPAYCSDDTHIREARRVFLWAAAKACSARLSMGEIGASAGGISAAAVSSALHRVDEQKLSCAALAESCNAVLAQMDLDESTLPADRWSRMYKRLTDYKEKFGHCLVPRNFQPDTQLGKWVVAQRLIFAGMRTTNDPVLRSRIDKLDSLGFSWNLGVPRWEKMFEKLKTFALLVGHCNVPANWELNPQLAAWVADQREAFRLHRLNKNHQKRLEKLGLDLYTSHTLLTSASDKMPQSL